MFTIFAHRKTTFDLKICPMTKEERHSLILDTLIKHESITVSNLSTLLEVSAVTIRKDLSELERSNRLYRSHGRAILIDPYINNRSIIEKESLARHEKSLIGQYATSLITKDDSIIIASGTTVLAMARCIKPNMRLTVISASLKVSELLGAIEDIELIQLGGTLRSSSLSVVGKFAEAPLSDFSCSKLFIGVDGIDLDFGITTTDMRESDLNRAMMRAAQKTIVLADSSKFRRRGFSKIADIEDVDMIITDEHIPDKIASAIEDRGVELQIVTDNNAHLGLISQNSIIVESSKL